MTPTRILIIKIIASAAILIGFSDMPYGFYQFLRWAVFAAALTGLWENAASQRSEGWKTFWGFFFGIMAILFNPVLRFHFERDTWQVLDAITLLGFLLNLIYDYRSKIFTLSGFGWIGFLQGPILWNLFDAHQASGLGRGIMGLSALLSFLVFVAFCLASSVGTMKHD